ncbi:MAG: guanylate kinase [Saprospiraceae bacterium]|nr:guanylate kinase [Saprospiraceae bacterium]
MKNGQEESGKLIVITAPSGAGKTTIVHHLLNTIDELAFSVSATSRAPRPHEEDGRDYYFLSFDEFSRRIEAGDFLEWEEVYENQFYGTLKSELERIWALGKHIIFDIDVKGALNIQSHYPGRCLTIFVKPPSKEILFDRLRKRRTESAASLKKRISRAEEELTYEPYFDDTLINDVLEIALTEAEQKVNAFLNLPVVPEWKQK